MNIKQPKLLKLFVKGLSKEIKKNIDRLMKYNLELKKKKWYRKI